MNNGNLDNIVLALLFSSDEPLNLRKISSLLDDVPTSEIKDAVETWQKRFDDEAWSIVLEKVAGGYQLSSRPTTGSPERLIADRLLLRKGWNRPLAR